jgi:hypothetical protein
MNPFGYRENAAKERAVELALEEWHHKDGEVEFRKESRVAHKDTLLCKACDREVLTNQVP